MEKVMGLMVVVRVNGFQEARQWIYRLVQDRVARCATCLEPATHVFWQDQAEWYCLCENHRECGPQWTGHTRWNPTALYKNVVPDKAREWIKTLTEDERKNVRLREFDATDYYSLLPEDYWKNSHRQLLRGTEQHGTFVEVFQMTNGEFVYHIKNVAPGRTYMQEFVGAFPTVEAAVDAATAEVNK